MESGILPLDFGVRDSREPNPVSLFWRREELFHEQCILLVIKPAPDTPF